MRHVMCLLADEIYPEYLEFAVTIHKPLRPMETFFTQEQAEVRKDVESCIGVRKSRFKLPGHEVLLWFLKILLG